MAWEALNNIASTDGSAEQRRLVIVVNDNGRSYTPTVGGLANHLTSLRTDPRYEPVLDAVKRRLHGVPGVGPAVYDALHAVKKGMKDALAPQGLFEDLGLKYVGPIDGHDRAGGRARADPGQAVQRAGDRARDDEEGLRLRRRRASRGRPVPLARDRSTSRPARRRSAGSSGPTSSPTRWCASARSAPTSSAITAAMLHPVGLNLFAERFPDRVFDVGIAEQHAATSAAGLAMGGLHPVVAVYATFLNRAFDQVLMDVALHRCGVTFVLDRAGVTGDDGASHNGMWDMSILQVVPGLRIAAPRDGSRLRELLQEAVQVADAPTVVRFPKGPPNADIEAVDRVGGVDVLVRTGARDVLIVSAGAMAPTCVEVADRLQAQGIGVTVVDPRWVKPVDPALVDLAARAPAGGQRRGQRHRRRLSARCCCRRSTRPAWTPRCGCTASRRSSSHHAKRARILERIGLTPQALARSIVEDVTALDRSDSRVDAGP